MVNFEKKSADDNNFIGINKGIALSEIYGRYLILVKLPRRQRVVNEFFFFCQIPWHLRL